MFKGFKNFDVFSKTVDELRVKTLSGGFLSIISCCIIIFLSLAEFNYYLKVKRIDRLQVDQSSEDRLMVVVNITFLAIPCDALNIDIMDVSGSHQEDVHHLFFKQRVTLDGKTIEGAEKGEVRKEFDDDPDDEFYNEDAANALEKEEDDFEEEAERLRRGGANPEKILKRRYKNWLKKSRDPNYCGSCYTGQKNKCCNNCEEVESAYQELGWAFRMDDKIEQCLDKIIKRQSSYTKKEGCRIAGNFFVKKVAGNFHFAPGRSRHTVTQHIHEYTAFEVDHFNTSHNIETLGFGKQYPGLENPLDGARKICDKNSGLYQYFIKVVPTSYTYYKQTEPVMTNQYAVTEHFRERKPGMNVVPGVYFLYDLSPIMVVIAEERESFFRFLTSLCAILGGVLVSSQMIDGCIYFMSKKKDQEKGRSTILK